ncbi:adenosylmethionine decarboxylase [Streptomyces sp. 4F14]|uniref:adenosylmethionine decarboxylase n=1 Tax=Streptomyces sp. 4F14 TaxID=3394380 RepID=UPI003A8AFFDA
MSPHTPPGPPPVTPAPFPGGEQGAGTHILADLVGASRLDDPAHAETVLRDCAQAAGALLLYVHVHHFGRGGGVSGVAVLAESHISVHSWPEYQFAAVDLFMCGAAEPNKAIPVLQAGFQPERIIAQELVRGRGALIPTPGDYGPELPAGWPLDPADPLSLQAADLTER